MSLRVIGAGLGRTGTRSLTLKALTPILLLILGWSAASGQTAQAVPRVSITVSDLDAILPFYEVVLTFERIASGELPSKEVQQLTGLRDADLSARYALLQLGQEQIELLEFENENQHRPIPADSRSNDRWFQHIAIVVSDMDAAYERLRSYKVQHVSTAPQTLPDYLPAAAGISAFYFRDPDGHNLELIYFPEGKGNPRWQEENSDLFLGIDHTAIGISDTDQSAAFYETVLGLRRAGNSENYGPEQERLNQVFGAHLLINGLTAQEGIGVEFLEYLAPPGGRPYPADSRPTDLWHWHTTVVVPDIEATYAQLQQELYTFISTDIFTFQNHPSFLVRDPDGHAVLVRSAQ